MNPFEMASYSRPKAFHPNPPVAPPFGRPILPATFEPSLSSSVGPRGRVWKNLGIRFQQSITCLISWWCFESAAPMEKNVEKKINKSECEAACCVVKSKWMHCDCFYNSSPPKGIEQWPVVVCSSEGSSPTETGHVAISSQLITVMAWPSQNLPKLPQIKEFQTGSSGDKLSWFWWFVEPCQQKYGHFCFQFADCEGYTENSGSCVASNNDSKYGYQISTSSLFLDVPCSFGPHCNGSFRRKPSAPEGSSIHEADQLSTLADCLAQQREAALPSFPKMIQKNGQWKW